MYQLQSEYALKENQRLSELLSYAQLDTSPDSDLDAITALASKVCGASSSMLNLIDLERQWSKSFFGLDSSLQQMPRSESMCTHTIQGEVLLEVYDVRNDPRFKHLPLAQEGSSIRHYAGIPLLTPGGYAIGALCVISDKPNKLTESQKESLLQLSKLAMNVIISKSPLNKRLADFSKKQYGILYIDPIEAKVLFANQQVGKFLSVDEVSLRNVSTTNLCSNWNQDFFTELNFSSSGLTRKNKEDTVIKLAEGDSLPVSVEWSVFNHYGRLLIVAFIQDMSESIAMADASQERTLFFELSRDVIAVCDADGNVLDINPSFTRVLGYKLEDLKDMSPLQLVHPDDFDETVLSLKKLSTSIISSGGIVNRVKDIHGEYKWFNWSSVRSESGKIYASATDITESRERERLLSIMQSAVERCQNPIIITNLKQPGGSIEYVNSAFEKTTGYSKAESIGRNCNFLQRDDKNQQAIQTLREAVSRREEAHVLVRNYRKDGSMFWNELFISPFKYESNDITHYVGVQYDITELVNQRDHIIRVNRIESLKSAFKSIQAVAANADKLNEEFCELTITVGQYAQAWIANVDSKTNAVTLAAATGVGANKLKKGQLLNDLPVAWVSAYLPHLFQNFQPVVLNTISNNLPQELKLQLISEGFNSIAFYPVLNDGRVDKIVGIYSNDVDAFDENESVLLQSFLDDYKIALQLVNSAKEIDRIVNRCNITDLPNQRLLANLASKAVKKLKINNNKYYGVFVSIVIDRSIHLMEQLGRIKGRELLQSVGQKLKSTLPTSAVLSHDEPGHFCLFIGSIKDNALAIEFVENELLPIFDMKFVLSGGLEFYLTPHVGIAVVKSNSDDIDSIIDQSKVAALANSSVHTPYQFYSESLTESTTIASRLEAEIREAILNEQFELHYQAKVNLRTNSINSLEGLLRWNHPTRGLVSPAEFIPVLEQTGLLVNLTEWLLKEGISCALSLSRKVKRPLRVAINLSQIQLRDPEFLQKVDQVMAEFALEVTDNPIDLEVTESLLAEDVNEIRHILKSLQNRGFHISIDDFGTGFSSLSYLAILPFDSLKIDLSFVRRMTVSVENMSIVSTIISLSKSLEKKVIAEGVETREQANLLRLINCTEAQGYLINKPCRQEELVKLLRREESIQFNTPDK